MEHREETLHDACFRINISEKTISGEYDSHSSVCVSGKRGLGEMCGITKIIMEIRHARFLFMIWEGGILSSA